jgi:multisubunit Na+/H+ antiporter MnhC subunit
MNRDMGSRKEWQRTVWLTAGALLFMVTLLVAAAFQGPLLSWSQTDAVHQAALAAAIVIDAALVSMLLALGKRPRTERVPVWRQPRR